MEKPALYLAQDGAIHNVGSLGGSFNADHPHPVRIESLAEHLQRPHAMTGEQLIKALQGEPLPLCQAGSEARWTRHQTRQKRRWGSPCRVNPTLQSIAQIKQGEQKLALGPTLHRRGLLTRALKIALQSLAVLTQVVAEKP